MHMLIPRGHIASRAALYNEGEGTWNFPGLEGWKMMTDPEEQRLTETPVPDVSDDEKGELFANNYAIAIAIGVPIGMVFGLLVLDNIAYGLLIGAGLAPIIAAVMSNVRSSPAGD